MEENKNYNTDKENEEYNQKEDFLENDIEEEEFQENDDDDDVDPQSESLPSLDTSTEEGIDENYYTLRLIETNFKGYMFGIDCKLLPNNQYEINIPRTFLPINLQVAYGFIQDNIALNLIVDVSDGWTNPHSKAYAKHPITGSNYTGSILVKNAIKKFFNPDYQPKVYYRSAPYFFYGTTTPDPAKVAIIVNEGFDEIQSKKALSLCRNDNDEALNFLRTGQINMSDHLSECKPPTTYKENPLIYLVLEVSDAIYDVQDHCSICGELISPGIKPAACEKESCKCSFIDIGIGTSLIQEIRRDPYVADLLISVFMCALDGNFLTPKPPNFTVDQIKHLMKKFPSVDNICKLCNDDQDLRDLIGFETYNLLRWIILTNRSQLVYLPKDLEIKEISNSNSFQFMAFIASPEQEDIFQQLKSRYGSIFMWHGSPTVRWHSILRTRIKIGSKNALGNCAEIFMAEDSRISRDYTTFVPNSYLKSKLGSRLQVISILEVVKLPSCRDIVETVYTNDPITGNRRETRITGLFNDNTDVKTLTMEEAAIIRFLIVNFSESFNICKNPPHLPTLMDILNAKSEENKT